MKLIFHMFLTSSDWCQRRAKKQEYRFSPGLCGWSAIGSFPMLTDQQVFTDSWGQLLEETEVGFMTAKITGGKKKVIKEKKHSIQQKEEKERKRNIFSS